MPLCLKTITLKTAKLGELGQFLTQVFEAEIFPLEEGALVKGDQNFHLLPSKSAQAKGASFDFSLDSKEEFDFFYNKLQFLSYRQGETLKLLPLKENTEQVFFSIKDPEGRDWTFSYDKGEGL